MSRRVWLTPTKSARAKSVRLPPAIWKELEKQARAEGVAVHALVRKAILAQLRSAT